MRLPVTYQHIKNSVGNILFRLQGEGLQILFNEDSDGSCSSLNITGIPDKSYAQNLVSTLSRSMNVKGIEVTEVNAYVNDNKTFSVELSLSGKMLCEDMNSSLYQPSRDYNESMGESKVKSLIESIKSDSKSKQEFSSKINELAQLNSQFGWTSHEDLMNLATVAFNEAVTSSIPRVSKKVYQVVHKILKSNDIDFNQTTTRGSGMFVQHLLNPIKRELDGLGLSSSDSDIAAAVLHYYNVESSGGKFSAGLKKMVFNNISTAFASNSTTDESIDESDAVKAATFNWEPQGNAQHTFYGGWIDTTRGKKAQRWSILVSKSKDKENPGVVVSWKDNLTRKSGKLSAKSKKDAERVIKSELGKTLKSEGLKQITQSQKQVDRFDTGLNQYIQTESDDVVYPQCDGLEGKDKVKCLIKSILSDDSINAEMKTKRLRYLIALSVKNKWATKVAVARAVNDAIKSLTYISW